MKGGALPRVVTHPPVSASTLPVILPGSTLLDSKGDAKSNSVPTPLQLACHGALHPSLPRDAWNLWRSVCRVSLVDYARASRKNDHSGTLSALVDFLRLPSRALLKQRGGRRRVGRRIRNTLQAILSKQRKEEALVNPKAPSLPRDPDTLRVARAVAFTRAGYISRATRALLQGDLADVNASVIQQLRDLHPKSSAPAPTLPQTTRSITVDNDLLRDLVRNRLKNGSAPGPSGWTGELLAPLVDDAECMASLAVLVEDILNGVLDDNARNLSWLVY